MSITPFDHPLLRQLLGDEEFAAFFSPAAELAEMIRFEAALASAEGESGVIPKDIAEALVQRIGSFKPRLAAIAKAAARDGTTGPEFVRQLRAHVGKSLAPHAHFGATSQDVVDTALTLRLKGVVTLFEQRTSAAIDALEHLGARFGAHETMGRTRMQDALPIPVGARIESWSLPLGRHLVRLAQMRPRLLVLQFGGPVGTLGALGNKGRRVSRRLARDLGLALPQRSWHSQRDNLAEFAAWLSLMTGTLGKMGLDLGLMAQQGEVEMGGGGGSSAMPHKANPVKAEALVALARFNATLLAGVHQSLLSEQERSGAAWSLEWLTLPQMVVAAGAALRTAIELAGSIESIGTTVHG